MSNWEKLNEELKQAGVPQRTFMNEPMEPVDTLVNTDISSKPFNNILLNYLSKLSGNECEMVVRALTEKSNKEISSELIPLFDRTDLSEGNLWAVGHALNIIKDKSRINEYIRICKNSELGAARSEIIRFLGSIRTPDIYDLLTELLNDLTIRFAVIEALGRMNNSEAVELLNSLELEPKSVENRNRTTALKRLQRAPAKRR
ncbi:HEAT repeat domain-containing protein [Roseivirga ehrenbergii]|nr:HEAT repeat domain-containing protein [Roseivirga ehrenbergii]